MVIRVHSSPNLSPQVNTLHPVNCVTFPIEFRAGRQIHSQDSLELYIILQFYAFLALHLLYIQNPCNPYKDIIDSVVLAWHFTTSDGAHSIQQPAINGWNNLV